MTPKKPKKTGGKKPRVAQNSKDGSPVDNVSLPDNDSAEEGESSAEAPGNKVPTTSAVPTSSAESLDWVECDKCRRWDIFENTGLPGEYCEEALSKIKYICRQCDSDKLIKKLSDENKELKTRVSVLEEALKANSKKYSDVVRGAVERESTQMKTDLIAIVEQKVLEKKSAESVDHRSVEDMVKKAVSEAVVIKSSEEEEIDRRKNNVIIYRVEEDKSDDGKAREAADISFLTALVEGPLKLDSLQSTDVRVIRLGKREEAKVRPMLVKFKSSELKSKFMMNLKNLKNADDRFKRISVAQDLTVKQRSSIKEAINKAQRDHDASGEQGNWRFRVVGNPMNPRVLRVKLS